MINKAKSFIAARRKQKRQKRQAEARKKLGFPALSEISATGQSYQPRFKYSVVTAAYGVETYIDEFFSSLVQQSVGFEESIEVIVVDDGSVDRTLEKARVWEKRYPESVTVLTQQNAGPAGARNAGLVYATGDWVTFTDPDDILAKDYFENVDRGICRNLDEGLQVDMVACNIVFYNEKNHSIRRQHPLNGSFHRGERLISYNEDLHDDVKLSVASSFLRRDAVVGNNLSFPDVRPSFEDAIFISVYLLALNKANVLFKPDCLYFYRKRQLKNSLVDTAWGKKDKYIDQISDGYISLLKASLNENNVAPRWVQRKVLYDLMWHFKVFFNNHKAWRMVSDDIRSQYFELLTSVFEYIDENVILEFELANIPQHMKLGVLNQFKGISSCSENVHLVKVDPVKREVLIGFYHVDAKVDLEFNIGGDDIEPLTSTIREFHYFDKPMVYETLAWIAWKADGSLTCRVDDTPVPVAIKGQMFKNASWHDVSTRFKLRKRDTRKMPFEKRFVRKIANKECISRSYKNAWLFIDRDTQADDNAEHLYRYVMNEHPDVNAFFVLRRQSHDWERLKREGFRMLEFGSFRHKVAMLKCEHLISSHADHYLFSLLPNKFYSDMASYHFTFLQHGVIKDDLSGWLNSKAVSCFVASAFPEYDSIVKPGSYKFTEKEVCLTGLPRHDRLLALANNRKKDKVKRVIVMPTWRQSLMGASLGDGNARGYNPEFLHSNFFESWQCFFKNSRLKSIVKNENMEILFFPHVNLEPYIEDFEVEGVNVVSHSDGVSIQDLLVKADLLITDFSSIAFESAYIGKPVLYFQFDKDDVFNGAHTYRQGYFDYDRDGFGPVAFSVNELVTQIEGVVERGFKPEPVYAERMREFFPFRDGKNCQRVYEKIKSLDSPEPTKIDRVPG